MNNFFYKFIPPHELLVDFVESIGMFCNPSPRSKQLTLLPDGRIDLFFWKTAPVSFKVSLKGLETIAEPTSIPPQTQVFVISFKPLAVEYLLQQPIVSILNSGKSLPDNFWEFNHEDFKDVESFYKKATATLIKRLPKEMDTRKQRLFKRVYATKGEMSIQELTNEIGWSSRQVNRYFNQQFGISLKVFCSILRFRASLEHIAKGKLFPELNFTDQNHFIKEVKKFAKEVPSTLSKNQNDRFVLLSILKQQ